MTNTVWLDLHAESKKQNNQTKPKTDLQTQRTNRWMAEGRHWGGWNKCRALTGSKFQL